MTKKFVERYRKHFSQAVQIFERGISETLTYLKFPASHKRYIKSTNMLERVFREVKRRTRVVGVFPSERSLTNMAKVVILRATEDWNFRRYLDMKLLWTMESKPTKFET